MQARQGKITGVIIKIRQVVMRLDVTGLVFQRLREIVERANCIAAIQLDDSQVALRLGYVIA